MLSLLNVQTDVKNLLSLSSDIPPAPPLPPNPPKYVYYVAYTLVKYVCFTIAPDLFRPTHSEPIANFSLYYHILDQKAQQLDRKFPWGKTMKTNQTNDNRIQGRFKGSTTPTAAGAPSFTGH